MGELVGIRANIDGTRRLREKRKRDDIEQLRRMDVVALRKLWDEIGDDSFSSGYDCADIHRVLNEKGDGAYCAV